MLTIERFLASESAAGTPGTPASRSLATPTVNNAGIPHSSIGCSVAVSDGCGGTGAAGPRSAAVAGPVFVSVVWMVATMATPFDSSGGTAARQRPTLGSSRCPVSALRFHKDSAGGASAQRRATSIFQSSDRQIGADAGSSCCAGHWVELVYFATRQAPEATCST